MTQFPYLETIMMFIMESYRTLSIINDKHSFFLYPKDKSNFLTNDSH